MLRCCHVKVIATQIIRSSSWTGWLLRNFHFSNNNEPVCLYEDCFLSTITGNTFTWLTFSEHLDSPVGFGGVVLIILLVFYVVSFLFFVCLLGCPRPVSCMPNVATEFLDCLVCLMLSQSFLIVQSWLPLLFSVAFIYPNTSNCFI